MGKLATFAELDREERSAAFEAAAALLSARILVAFIPLRYWRDRFLHTTAAQAIGSVATHESKSIALVRQAIKRAMRNAPLDYICLPQALAARWMLDRRGIASELRIGAMHNDSGRSAVHAWLWAGGDFVTGDCDPSKFALIGPDRAR